MDELLANVQEYRAAARQIVRAETRSVQDRCLALVQLSIGARAEEDPTLRGWAERAVWEEARSFLGEDYDIPSLPNLPYVIAQRKLRDKGLDICPTCRGVIADAAEFERWRNLEADWLAEVARRELAVPDATA